MENGKIDLMGDYGKALQAIYDHVGFVEDWVVYPICDSTDMYWRIDVGSIVEFGESEDNLIYENDIYTQRFYKKWVYRGKDYTLIIVDTHTDGNKFFQIFDNSKEY